MEGGDSSLTIRAKFVSKKISKIRWRPTNQEIVEQPTLLVTGSWDEEDAFNSVDLWTADASNLADSSQLEENGNPGDEFDVPIHLHSLPHCGDVTDLLFLGEERILVASSTGDVTLLRCDGLSQNLSRCHVWEGIHCFSSGRSSPCTALASRDDGTFVSVGEDGRLNVVSLESGGPDNISAIENADSTSMTGVCFLRQKEVATINAIGQFKVWDLRKSMTDPARVLVLKVISGPPVALRCLDQHPTQPHIVATGSQNGDLYIWDMRQDRAPATLVTCHQSDIWEVRFHPTLPDSLFTCSNEGSVFQWSNSSQMKLDLFGQSWASSSAGGPGSSSRLPVKKAGVTPKGRAGMFETASTDQDVASWLMDETASKDRLIVNDLLPGHDMSVNSLDIIGSTLICGTDGEEILMMQKLQVF